MLIAFLMFEAACAAGLAILLAVEGHLGSREPAADRGGDLSLPQDA